MIYPGKPSSMSNDAGACLYEHIVKKKKKKVEGFAEAITQVCIEELHLG